MFLSDRDIKYAIEIGALIVKPPPCPNTGYDKNSIDLHLDCVENAKVWAPAKANQVHAQMGGSRDGHLLELGPFDYKQFAGSCLEPVPEEPANPAQAQQLLVFRRGQQVIVRPQGFLLWTTKEIVGTPEDNPELISFVNAKSTKARTGIMVHFTAPTINTGWEGNIVLEIINLGPFTFSLRPGDAIAQLTVAMISSRPDIRLRAKKSITAGQVEPGAKTG